MTKLIYTIVFFNLAIMLLAQQSNDTIIFNWDKADKYYLEININNNNGDIKNYKVNGIKVSYDEYYFYKNINDSVHNARKNNYGKYHKFYRKGILIEEGIFIYDAFIGPYKDYYKNGNLKSEGIFSKNFYKIGTWKYYRKNTKLYKTEIYNDDGNNQILIKKY